jgi:hypothetical protein
MVHFYFLVRINSSVKKIILSILEEKCVLFVYKQTTETLHLAEAFAI